MASKKTSSRTGKSTKKAKTSTRAAGATKKRPASRTAATQKPAPAASGPKKKAAARRSTAARKTTSVESPAAPSDKSSAVSVVRAKKRAGKGTAKRGPANAVAVEKPEPPLPKTRLTDKQLAMFKEMLLEKRQELLGDVRTLTKDALGKSRQDSTGDLSSMPIHMADIGSDNWEQDFTLGLIANEQQLVREIDESLARIEDRTYGVCLATRRPISIARLRAKPWAKYCIEYARQHEVGRY